MLKCDKHIKMINPFNLQYIDITIEVPRFKDGENRGTGWSSKLPKVTLLVHGRIG